MKLLEREGFVARLSIVGITQLPLTLVSKPILNILQQKHYDVIYEKLKQDGEFINIDLDQDEKGLLINAAQICLDEENQSLIQFGKSVSFQNYLTNKYGSIIKEDFINLIDLLKSHA